MSDLSTCCKAPVEVVEDEDGAGYYQCTKCGEGCYIVNPEDWRKDDPA